MAFTIGAIAAKDGLGSAIGGGLLAADTVGGGTGPFFIFNGLVDGVAGSNKAQITAANALKVDGSAVTQPISGTVTANAGTNLNTSSLALETGGNLAAVAAPVGTFGSAMPAKGYGIGLWDGTNMVHAKGDETSGIWVNIKAGAGSGGTAIADEAAFTEGATNITPIGGVFKTSHTALTSGQAGALALSAGRHALTDMNDGAGTALTSTGAALDVNLKTTGLDVGSGTGGAKTQRVIMDTAQLAASVTTPQTISNGAQAVTLPTDVPVPAIGFQVTCSTDVTRPADTNIYAANDAWADSTSAPTAGGFTFTGAGRTSGGSGIITDLSIISSNDPSTLLQGEIWIFDSAPTAVDDNAAFALSDSDAKKLVGVVPFTLASTTGGSGTNSFASVQNLNLGFTCVGTTNLRYLVKVKNAYTPASAEVLTVRAKVIETN